MLTSKKTPTCQLVAATKKNSVTPLLISVIHLQIPFATLVTMITPLFKLSQDEEYLYVTITAPNLRLGEAELFYESTEFIFHAKPYYLRLELPGQVKPSERIEPQDNCLNEEKMEINPMKMKFDFDTNKLIVPVPKMNVGEHFADLEMIGKFLSGPKSKASHRLIEVLDSNQSTPLIDDLMNEEEDFDWNIEQKLPEQEGNIASLLGKEPYGFCNSHSGLLERLGQELTHDLVEIKAPGKLCRTERRKQRLAKEESDFSEDHYIADLFEPDVADQIDQRITAVAPWDTWNSTTQESILTDEDRQRMIDHLPKRDFLKYDSETSKALLLGVVDILYGYAYDLRAFDFEYTSESSWTIGKLSPTLSWFEHWTPIDKLPGDLAWASKDIRVYVLASCIRRALIYPLYRNWNLAIKVARDVATILSKGRSAILKCFLGNATLTLYCSF